MSVSKEPKMLPRRMIRSMNKKSLHSLLCLGWDTCYPITDALEHLKLKEVSIVADSRRRGSGCA